MTVAELIELLKTFPQDIPVGSFETGDNDPTIILPEGVTFCEGGTDDWLWDPGTIEGSRESFSIYRGPHVWIHGGIAPLQKDVP